MIEAYKFRLYPNEDQKVLLSKHFGTVRFVYNWALNYSQEQYKTNRKFLGWQSLAVSDGFRELKASNLWMKEVNSQSICNSMAHLGRAFDNFFKDKADFPTYKSKYDHNQSFEVPAGLKIDFKEKKIQIPKFINRKSCDNRIKVVISRHVKKGKIGTATISRNACGQYFVSFLVHTSDPYPELDKQITKERSLGIDFGLKHFINFSNGEKVDSPEYFKHTLDKLRRAQRKLSKKQKGSKNKEKQRIKVARIHQKIKDQRKDFLHHLSTSLVKDSQFDVFCVEDLNLDGMKRIWGRKVSDLSYYDFQRMLEYKCVKYGKVFIKIGRFEPSSQICSSCGHRQKLGLNDRTYVCQKCGAVIDRDTNAAINIRDFAIQRSLATSSGHVPVNTDGTSGINACGVGSSGKCGASCACETSDCEAGMFSHIKRESQRSSVVE